MPKPYKNIINYYKESEYIGIGKVSQSELNQFVNLIK